MANAWVGQHATSPAPSLPGCLLASLTSKDPAPEATFPRTRTSDGFLTWMRPQGFASRRPLQSSPLASRRQRAGRLPSLTRSEDS